MSRRRRLGLLLVAGVLSVSVVASATTMRALTVADLTEQADLVVVGRVESTADVMTVVDGELVPRQATRILPTTVVRGEAPDGSIVVVERGGRDRTLVVAIEGTASFRRGQEVLLFLARTSEGYRPVGHAQGAFAVGRDRRSGEARIRRSGDPGILVGGTVDKGLDVGAAPRLDDVLARVRAVGAR